MTREQLEAWCTLEGLRLVTWGKSPVPVYIRIAPVGHKRGDTGLHIEKHREPYLAHLSEPYEYTDYSWTELPEAAYNSLTLEMLESIKR